MKKYLLFTIGLFILPLVSFAQAKYEPLVNIPGLSDGGAGGFSTYINFLYAASISIAALLAVIKIIVAGVKYMMTDVVSTKSNAKGEIQGALLGLLLILGAYIILYIINPRLINPTVEFEKIPASPTPITRPSITVGGQTTDMAQSSVAANAGASLAARGGCNVKTTTTLGNNNITSLDMSGCKAGYDPAPVLGAFAKDCSAKNGRLSSTKPMTYSCATEKPGALISNYGTVTQKKSTTPTTLTQADPIAQAADLKSACEDKHGQYSISNGPTGTYTGAVVTCKLPGIISYSGSQAQYGQGDCASRTPKGVYEPHTTSADLCLVW